MQILGGFYVVPSMANVRLTDHDEIVESTLLDIAAFDILQLVLRLVGVACCMSKFHVFCICS